jgi:gliding motility-associated-like protein
LEFFVNLSNAARVKTPNLQVYFTPDSFLISTGTPQNVPYQLENPLNNWIDDTLNWKKLSWEFIATGNERFITIGNFKDDNSTLWDSTGVGMTQIYTSYIFIEDVSLVCCDPEGCEPPDVEFFLPTAFSPNGDGNNDVLHVRGPVKEMDLYIYNRWGELIFHGTDPSKGWDGTYKGELLNAGVFVYYFRGTLLDGTEISQKGNVTLVR